VDSSSSILSSTPAASSTEAAVEVLATAFKLPMSFDLVEVSKLPALQRLKNHPLYDLLNIHINEDGLARWGSWRTSNASTLTEFG
jgi:hypothetical protein